MRFKPPPSIKSKIGWRVEYRTLDIQLTDFENSAFTILLLLTSNIVNNYDVDFILPISLVDSNMDKAHIIDSAVDQKFYFNINSIRSTDPSQCSLKSTDFLKSNNNSQKCEPVYEELYLWEILEGVPSKNFIGLYALFYKFMNDQNYS